MLDSGHLKKTTLLFFTRIKTGVLKIGIFFPIISSLEIIITETGGCWERLITLLAFSSKSSKFWSSVTSIKIDEHLFGNVLTVINDSLSNFVWILGTDKSFLNLIIQINYGEEKFKIKLVPTQWKILYILTFQQVLISTIYELSVSDVVFLYKMQNLWIIK